MVALLDEMMVDCWVDTKDVYLVDQRVEKWAESMVDLKDVYLVDQRVDKWAESMVDYWAVKKAESWGSSRSWKGFCSEN